ncbi:MAG: hypothetical protein IJ214_00715 [Clostridia bacterium]|nr:hypothetical protein [Clostridia bacterium]
MPLRETAFQGYTFLALIYAGAVIAFLYDLALPALNSPSWPAHVLADLLLCAAAASVVLAALFLTGCGSLRLYMALALLCGALIYRLGIRRFFSTVINLLRRNRNSARHSE